MNTDMVNTGNTKKDVFFLVCLLVGYVVVCALPSIFGIGSRNFAIPYRILVFFFSINILLKNFNFGKSKLPTIIIFTVFWMFYFFKILYSFNSDFYLSQFVNQEYEVYIRIFVIYLFPCLALLSIDYEKVNFKYLLKAIFWYFL